MIEKMWNTNRKADILEVVFSAIIAETNANQTSQTNETILNHAINYSDIQTRIVGGSNVASGQGTFVVRLVFRPAGECTGAIIGRRYILTAGHCVNGKTGGVIYGGTVSRDDPNPIVTQMSRLFKHPQYGTTYGGYDVDIIEVARDLDLSGRQTSVVLTSSVINFNHRGFQFGWSQCKNSAMRNLQKLSVGFLNTANCKRHGGHEHQYPEMICVDPGSTAKSCPGDSGGPIISSGKVVGILSGAHDILGVPMYAQNVYHYLAWIKNCEFKTDNDVREISGEEPTRSEGRLVEIRNTWRDVKRAFSLLCVKTFSSSAAMLEAPPGSREDLVEAARTPCTPTDLDTMLYGYTNSIYVLDHTPESLPDMDMLQLFASPAGRALVTGDNRSTTRSGSTSTSLSRESSSRAKSSRRTSSTFGVPTPPPRQRKSSAELYKEAVEILGLTCSLTDSCRCLDCQSNYFDCDDDCGDPRSELAAGTPILLDHALSHPLTCSIQ